MRVQAVTDLSQVAEARRTAVETAHESGFDETQAGRVALVATELATNIVKHGGGGEMLLGSYDDPSGSGMELIALDKGRGIADLARCLQDGYSSAGSSGHGLGAIRRQSTVMEIASWPAWALPFWRGSMLVSAYQRPESHPPWGCVSVPDAGTNDVR